VSGPPNGSFYYCLRDCEKLSEVFKPFGRTFHAFPRQPALVPNIRFTWKEGLMAKQTTITVETDSLLILRGRSSRHGWCPRCEAEVETIALEDTGVITNLERPALEEWLNSEELHRLHAADGSAVTCLNSLIARVQKTKPANCGNRGCTTDNKEAP
jgi:hypothetical protein